MYTDITMIESLHEKGPQVKKNVEMPRRDWLLKALDHLPDSVVKKFRLREKWLGESTEQTEQPEQPVANENSKEVEFTQWKNQLKREDLAPLIERMTRPCVFMRQRSSR